MSGDDRRLVDVLDDAPFPPQRHPKSKTKKLIAKKLNGGAWTRTTDLGIMRTGKTPRKHGKI
jgi:hypothetical protein